MRRHVQGRFLKRSVLCFDQEEVNEDQFECNPHAVHDVVLPRDSGERDGVNVLVEYQGCTDGETENSVTLCSQIERKNFKRVRCDQWRVGHAVRGAVEN